MKLKSITASAIAALVLCTGVAFAQNTFNVTVAQGSSADTWVYTIWNNDSTGLIPIALDIEWEGQSPADYELSSMQAPDNWSINGFHGLYYPAWDFEPASGEPLTYGESLSGFIVTTSEMPTLWTIHLEDVEGVTVEDQMGIAGPASMPTPEPASLAALFGGIATLGALVKRRRA